MLKAERKGKQGGIFSLMAGITFRLFGALRSVAIVFWTVFWISASLVVALVTFNRRMPLKMGRRIWAPGVLALAGMKLKVGLLPAVDWARPHIFAMNHQSMLDIPVAFAVLPVDLRFIAKHSLARVPFLGWYMTLTGMVFVNRSRPTIAYESLARAARRIRDGVNILVYPEGTRPTDGRLLPFKRGAFGLAIDAGVPVVPVAVNPSWRCLPSGHFVVSPGEVQVRVGEPISTSDRTPADRDTLTAEVHDAVASLLEQMSSEAR